MDCNSPANKLFIENLLLFCFFYIESTRASVHVHATGYQGGWKCFRHWDPTWASAKYLGLVLHFNNSCLKLGKKHVALRRLRWVIFKSRQPQKFVLKRKSNGENLLELMIKGDFCNQQHSLITSLPRLFWSR